MAEKQKEVGNECMKQDKFVEAMVHYTEAVKLNPNIAAIYTNRCLAFLKMQQYYLAMEDAKMAIKLEPKWFKGYYRMGEVQYHVELYKDALWSFKQALNFSSDEEKIKDLIQETKAKHSAQHKAEKRLPVYGVIIGMVLGVFLCIADQVFSEKGAQRYVLIQGLIVVFMSALCYTAAVSYRFYLKSQRQGLLAEPLNIFNDEQESSRSTGKPAASGDHINGSAKARKRVNAASAKHKARQNSKT